ncbi:MAG TPA: hypothetical protein VFZ52_14325 [Chryseolinea sp.]
MPRYCKGFRFHFNKNVAVPAHYDQQLNHEAPLNRANQMIDFGLETGKRDFVLYGYYFIWRTYSCEHNLSLAYGGHAKYSQQMKEFECDQRKQKIAMNWIVPASFLLIAILHHINTSDFKTILFFLFPLPSTITTKMGDFGIS